MEQNDAPRNRRALKALLDANGYRAHRISDCGYEVPFSGKLRDWHIRARIYNGWLSLNTYLMEIPAKGPQRSELLERMLEVNDVMNIAKFSKSQETLSLDVEYREEHVDAAAFNGLILLMHSLCEQYYPELFRIASGDSALESLEEAFQRPALSTQSDTG
jgi:hypothetical protein